MWQDDKRIFEAAGTLEQRALAQGRFFKDRMRRIFADGFSDFLPRWIPTIFVKAAMWILGSLYLRRHRSLHSKAAHAHHRTGLEALAYSRWRIGSSDYNRMQRQRCLVRAAADQLDPLTLARSFHTLADVIERSVVTDIPVAFLPDLVDILGGVNLQQVSTVGLVPPTYNSGRTPGGYPVPNVDRIRAKVAEVLEDGSAETGHGDVNECGM